MGKKHDELGHDLRLIMKTFFVLLTGSFICKVLTYIYRIIIARMQGSEVYGLFSIASMIFGLFTMISLAGVGEGIVRYISYYRGLDDRGKIKRIYKTSMKILIFTSIIAAAIMYFSAGLIAEKIFHTEELVIFIQLFAISLPLFTISRVFTGTMRAYEKISTYSLVINIVEPAVKIVLLLILIFIGFTSGMSIGFSAILGTLIVLIYSYYYCKKYLLNLFINEKEDKTAGIIKDFIKYSIPVMFSIIIFYTFGWTDTFFLGFFKTVKIVGIYNVALPLGLLFTLTPQLFSQLFFPIVNKEYSRGNIALIRELSKQLGKWVFIINLPALFIFIFFPGAVINIMFGKEYLEAAIPLVILSAGFFISAQAEVSLNLLAMMKKSGTRLFNISSALMLNVILDLILIPMPKILMWDNASGMIGAALATSIALTFHSVLVLVQVYSKIKIIPVRKKMGSVLLSCFVGGAMLFIAKSFLELNIFNLAMLILFFVLAYILMIFLTRALDRNDIMIIDVIKKKMSKK
jgi:O-antigen/teichoic acid export membrane protein